ncbi:MAG: hypothetical protein ACOX6T_16480 [Myxococcales bacterium]|jgi:hypothetical protein
MKNWLVLMSVMALACGGGNSDGLTPDENADAGSKTEEKGLWIDASSGLTLNAENKVSSMLEVKRGTKVLETATLTANGVEIDKYEDSTTFKWALSPKDVGAQPGKDIELVATDNGETATLKVPCPSDVTIAPVSGPLTAGQKITVSWTGAVHYPDPWSKPNIGVYPCDADGSHIRFPPPGDHSKTLDEGATSVELTVPDSEGREAYIIRLHVYGTQVDNAQGKGHCTLTREQVVTGSAD